VAKRLHQGVHADVCVGQLGRERMAQPVHEGAAGAIGIDAGAAKCASLGGDTPK